MYRKLPDEPSVAHVLRTGEPFQVLNLNEEDIFELGRDEFVAIVLRRREREKRP